ARLPHDADGRERRLRAAEPLAQCRTFGLEGSTMSQQLTFVILSSGLDSLRELRGALAASDQTRLLAAGDDTEQMLPEIERLRPDAAIVTFGPEPEQALKFVERVAAVSPATAVVCASRDAS